MTEVTSRPTVSPVGIERPTRPRSRVRVPLLAAGLGLVLASTVILVWGFSRAADRVDVLMIVGEVEAGTPIAASDLATTTIGVDDGVGQFYPPGTDLTGAVAAVDLAPGDVLSPALLKAEPTAPAGSMEVGAVVRAGRFPTTIAVGDHLVAVSSDVAVMGEVTVMVVSSVIGEDAALATVIAVPATDATRVAQWSATESLVLVRVP